MISGARKRRPGHPSEQKNIISKRRDSNISLCFLKRGSVMSEPMKAPVRHCLDYEDNNDAALVSKDSALKIMAGKVLVSADHLASQLTLSRFENRVTCKDLRRLSDCLPVCRGRSIHPGGIEI
jgi:hypothetical protein